MLDDEATPGIQDILAQNLRRLRIARHLSLSELARATRMSKATLSSIENGRANPTVETLAALAGALRISLIELLEELPPGEVRVMRAAESGGDSPRRLEVFEAATEVEVVEIALPARELCERAPGESGSRTHVYVLQGKVITGPVERLTELTAGDYASFPSDVPHVLETSRHPARVLALQQRTG
jgi:transcriptional regulator with XRE-family HTH domain